MILRRSDVSRLLDLDLCISAVEEAFRLYGLGEPPAPVMTGVHVPAGGFHVKAGVLGSYFAAKTNANFMENRIRFGLPTIQGSIVLHDASNGVLLALLDSIEISMLRTGAATAVAAKYLARRESATVAVAGCGAQGRVQLRALARVLPLKQAFVWDIERSRAEQLVADLQDPLGMSIVAVDAFSAAAKVADVCVTCTPSATFIIGPHDVQAGSFVAGIGVDNPHKREIDPALMAGSSVVVDVLEQCEKIGDLHHAVECGAMTRDGVYAELGEIVAGHKVGRKHADDIIVFDSTGMALQDVAAAAVVYERAVQLGVGQRIGLAS